MKFKYCFIYSKAWSEYILYAQPLDDSYESRIISHYINELGIDRIDELDSFIRKLGDYCIVEYEMATESFSSDIQGDNILFSSLYFEDEPEFLVPRKKLFLLLKLWKAFIELSDDINASVVIDL